VVVGDERRGLPSCWLEAASALIAVPMPGPVDSLDVAVAAGVVLCETTRRRHAPRARRETAARLP
jgi:tRNA G18 (ribose-2'-O)-methylase SpoU